MIPVVGIRAEQLSDTFDDGRGGGTRAHHALDIVAPRGTPVVAAAAGTVEKLFHSDAGGNTVYVRSPDRTTIFYYAHLDRYAEGLQEGQSVTRGQQLGFVGSTGDANPAGPHLHFEIMRTTPEAKWYQPATDINPYPLLTGKQP
jgi:murein DD-endopeptidase MepM/ murein hydrolase activator NlpD